MPLTQALKNACIALPRPALVHEPLRFGCGVARLRVWNGPWARGRGERRRVCVEGNKGEAGPAVSTAGSAAGCGAGNYLPLFVLGQHGGASDPPPPPPPSLAALPPAHPPTALSTPTVYYRACPSPLFASFCFTIPSIFKYYQIASHLRYHSHPTFVYLPESNTLSQRPAALSVLIPKYQSSPPPPKKRADKKTY